MSGILSHAELDSLCELDLPSDLGNIGAARWVVYGAGNRGRQAKNLLESRGAQVVGFLDQNAAPGQQLDGVPVVSPHSPAASMCAGVSILVAVFNHLAPLTPIYAALEPLGSARIVSFWEFHAAFADSLGDLYWLTDRRFYREAAHREALHQTLDVWADHTSRAVFSAVLRLRLAGQWHELESLRAPSQYFPPDVPLPDELHLADCGACLGDAVENALAAGREVKSLWAFEPDSANFQSLAARLPSLVPGATCALWPCGVWSHTTQLRFAGGAGASSHLDAAGDQVVSCVALDDALGGAPVNFLKMDIEGAEPQALEGALELLQKQKPHAAICAYHRPEHLWSLWQQIQGCAPGYRFFLRSHEFNGFDMVLYAVPN